MTDDALIGQQPVYEFLLKSFKGGQSSHAYLLAGPRSVGKTTVVTKLLQNFFCENNKAGNKPCGQCSACRQVASHSQPDIWWLNKEEDKKDITIDQIRQVKSFTNLASLAGDRRVVVIEEAENLNTEASNALLKVLEEPLGRAIFFLISHQPKSLLPTIRSRCFMVNCGLVAPAVIKQALLSRHKMEAEQAAELSHLAGGRPGVALTLAAEPALAEELLQQVKSFIAILGRNPWGEFQQFAAATLKTSEESHQSEAEKIDDHLKRWLEAVRDILLLKLNLPGLVRYQSLKTDLAKLSKDMSVMKILKLGQQIAQARRKIKSNANIRLTLESLVLNFYTYE
jgi:DNA polymerase-3 subunit delta'